ncbi:SCP2 domain-containing protein [Pseudoalteromonas fenneropenaei]|uniref:Ubiquinone biosynthesis accessory factor UbiJ n=1 Tax=Pseudoalteromonas fenneropenaei TaxID=1737459 RepID=A0ABV7CNR3_9GAMM
MLKPVLGAIAEQGLNRLLTLAPALSVQLQAVAHQILVVEIRDWQQQLALTFTGQRFHVFVDYPERGDCWVSADFATLASLQDPSQLTLLIRQERLDLEGDLHLAQSYSKVFANLHIDWPEQLSHYIGDAPAQQLWQLLQQGRSHATVQHGLFTQTLTQLCQDELKVAIHPLELQQFTSLTRTLKAQVDKLEQRIEALLAHPATIKE